LRRGENRITADDPAASPAHTPLAPMKRRRRGLSCGGMGLAAAPNVARTPLHPKNPERICWGCDKYCPAEEMRCGNGTIRAPHPIELFGQDWLDSTTDSAERPRRTGDIAARPQQ